MEEKELEIKEVLNISFPVMVTQEDIDDIMCSALEGGINYWCDKAEVDEGKRVADWGHEQIARGGELKIHVVEPFDDEDTEWYTLTKEKFLKGLEMYLKKPNCGYFLESANLGLKLDTCYADAEVADSIIQYALFGEEIYG